VPKIKEIVGKINWEFNTWARGKKRMQNFDRSESI